MRTMFRTIALLALATAPMAAQSRRSDAVDLTGKWDVTVSSQGQVGTSEVTLIQKSDSLIGKYVSQTMGELQVVGTVKGRDFSFAYNTNMNGQPLTFTVKGVVQTADSLSGTATMGPLGNATFSARRQRR